MSMAWSMQKFLCLSVKTNISVSASERRRPRIPRPLRAAWKLWRTRLPSGSRALPSAV